MFRLSKDYVIDATFKGSQARYLNHCCDPNCGSILVDNRLFIYSKRDINSNEELTYDY